METVYVTKLRVSLLVGYQTNLATIYSVAQPNKKRQLYIQLYI